MLCKWLDMIFNTDLRNIAKKILTKTRLRRGFEEMGEPRFTLNIRRPTNLVNGSKEWTNGSRAARQKSHGNNGSSTRNLRPLDDLLI